MCCFSAELVEHLTVYQFVVVVAETQKIDMLLAVEAAQEPVCRSEHFVVVLQAICSDQTDTTRVERSWIQWRPYASFRHGVP
jgi:hypothetical protein